MKHIVVLGHAQCGGVRAFAEEAEPLSPGDFIGNWMALIAPAAGKVGPRGDRPLADYLTQLEQATVVKRLDNLMTFRMHKLVERGRSRACRLFRRGNGPTLGARSGDRKVRAGRGDDYTRLFAQPRF